MQISIIIPAHNEATYIKDCLNTFVAQTQRPDELLIVDDNSTDNTYTIATKFAKEHSWIRVLQYKSSTHHLPGKKVINAFNFGLSHTTNYDLIGKFDADIKLPPIYFEQMRKHFKSNWKLGMCSGLLYIKKNNEWIYENIANKKHIRGPIKLYHKACFTKIEGLRSANGWDTVDILLAKYYDFDTLTDLNLKVQHLRATGHGYSTKNYKEKGEALYKMRYGIVLAKIALLKMAWQTKSLKLYIQGIFSYIKAYLKGEKTFVTKPQGKFIRRLRWKGIFSKLIAKR